MKLLAILMLTAACHAPPVPNSGPVSGWWKDKPILVLISEDLSLQCRASVVLGLMFWAEKGQVNYLEPLLVTEKLAQVPIGAIRIIAEPADNPMDSRGRIEAGVTSVLRHKETRQIRDAEIKIEKLGCHPRIAAHELGHALGLLHSTEVGNLMEEAPTGSKLDNFQLSHVHP